MSKASNAGKGATGTRETRQVLGFTLKETWPLEDFESRKEDKIMFVRRGTVCCNSRVHCRSSKNRLREALAVLMPVRNDGRRYLMDGGFRWKAVSGGRQYRAMTTAGLV